MPNALAATRIGSPDRSSTIGAPRARVRSEGIFAARGMNALVPRDKRRDFEPA